MANDNTLGAPTEGLGQNVTFSDQSGSGVPRTGSVQRGNLRLSASGGGAQRTANALSIPPAAGPTTFQALMKLGGEIIRPHVEAAQNEQFMAGMQQAAQGEAITEIVNEQPWYSKIFGSSSLVDGARAYTASAKATSVAVNMEERMPELRKMAPDEFARYTNEQVMKARTGDSVADMMLTQQIASTLPAVMKGQAKAHFRYQQEIVEQGIGDNITANFSLLQANDAQARTPDATKDAEDVLGANIKVIQALQRPDDMEPAHFDAIVGERAIRAIENGNFAAYDHLETSGRLDKMPANIQAGVRRAKAVATSQAHTKLPYEFQIKQAEWQTLATAPGTTDEDIVNGAKALDEEYYRLTGDRTPFAGGAPTVRELIQRRNVEAAQQASLARQMETARTKEAKAQAEVDLVTSLAGSVSASTGYYMGNQKPEVQQKVFDLLRAQDQARGTSNLYTVLAKGSMHNRVDETTKTLLEGGVQDALRVGSAEMLNRTYNEYAKFVAASGDNGQIIAAQYAGASHGVLARYHTLAQSKPNPSQLDKEFFYSQAIRPEPKEVGDDKKRKGVLAELSTGTVWGLVKQTFNSDDVPLQNPEGLRDILMPRLSSSLPLDQAVEKAKRDDPNLTILGGYHWVAGTQQSNLNRWLLTNKEIGSNEFNRATKHSVDKLASEAGIDGGVMVSQISDDADGNPRLYVSGMGSDGNAKFRSFTAKDLVTNWKEHKKSKEWTKADFQFGPKLTNVPADDVPSIYASPAEWKAYRAKQQP